jgi:hypothetical protein
LFAKFIFFRFQNIGARPLPKWQGD